MQKRLGLGVVLAVAGTLILSGVSLAGFCTDNGLPDGCIQYDDLHNSSVRAAAIAPNVVHTGKIKDGTIRNEDLADDAVNSAKVLNESLTGDDIDDDTITASDVASDSIPATDLSNEAGVAFSNTFASIGLTVSPGWTVIRSLGLVAPTSGFVTCICTGSLYWDEPSFSGTISIGVDDNTATNDPPINDLLVHLPAASVDAATLVPLTAMATFSVTAGSKALACKGHISTGTAGDIDFRVNSFTCMFFPTNY